MPGGEVGDGVWRQAIGAASTAYTVGGLPLGLGGFLGLAEAVAPASATRATSNRANFFISMPFMSRNDVATIAQTRVFVNRAYAYLVA